MLETRPRVLVVEDDEPLRETYLAHIRLDGSWYGVGAAGRADALGKIDRQTFHVALVDIMLQGPKNASDRGGVAVLEELHALGEGTRSIVLSAQDSPQETRDFLKRFHADDYIAKATLQREGAPYLFQAMRNVFDGSPLARRPTWEDVVANVAPGQDEESFVAEVMNGVSFKGGFENLRDTLTAAVRHLLPIVSDGTDLEPDPERGGLSGRFWSKGQGCGIVLRIATQGQDDGLPGDELVRRERRGLLVQAVRLQGAERNAFSLSAGS